MLGLIEWLYSRIVDRCPAMPPSEMGHLQKFPKPKDMAALPSKAEIGDVTGTQAPELIAQGCCRFY
jgi:hypothetical protein